MDYLAFILFGIGLLLVLTGLLLNGGDKEPVSVLENRSQPPEQPPQMVNFSAKVSQPSAPPIQTDPSVAVKVVGENPKLFRKSAYLYLDSSGTTSYGSLNDLFTMENVSDIRRFGKGNFSYDGFSFHFEHDNGRQNFPLEALEQIAFYPNCIVLVPKDKLPTALLFVDETESIRRLLETFRVDHGN